MVFQCELGVQQDSKPALRLLVEWDGDTRHGVGRDNYCTSGGYSSPAKECTSVFPRSKAILLLAAQSRDATTGSGSLIATSDQYSE